MRRKRNLRILFAVAVSGMVFFTGCGLLPKEEEVLAPPLTPPKKQEYQTFDVTRKAITNSILGNGNLISTSENNVFVKDNGKRVKTVNVKFGDTVKKGDLLIQLESGVSEDDLEMEKLNLEKIQVNYDRAMAGTDEYGKKLADIDLKMEKLRLQKMEEQVAAARVTAPAGGRVIYVTSAKEGDTVEAYKTLITIADPNNLKVKYTPSGANNAKPGMKVELTYSTKTYEGTITQIPESGNYKGCILITSNTRIEGANIDDSIGINIIMQKKDDALVLPKSVIKSFSGTQSVEVLDGDKIVSMDVQTGIEADTEVEILSGLKEGQKVILR
ncbi:MAG: efflux RND transporter periplasmic adaptor subunit [Bacillota bacterium]|nr:efflux RND transporter periplasmic adaptor subunit [Bacillota bacterium]